MAAGAFIPNFHFSQGNVYYSASEVTFSGSAAINANGVITTSNQVIQMRNISITSPKSEVEVVNLMGVEATAVAAGVLSTGSFQNQIYDEKSWTDGTLTGTLVLTGHNDGTAAALPDFLSAVTGAGMAIGTTYHRHTFGDDTSDQIRVTVGCVIVVMKNGSEEVTVALNKPYVNLGDIKPTGDDGYYECDVEIKALAKNFAIEVKDFD